MKKAVTAIIQARMGSSRLPGKVLKEIAGEPMLGHVVTRTRRASTVDDVIVATSTAGQDDDIEAYCRAAHIAIFRGSEDDVLDRYYKAAEQAAGDIVVRVTADCPMIDPDVVDRVVQRFAAGRYDYVSNVAPPTFPDGLDTEVVSLAALRRAWREARLPSEREHVTLHIRNHPELFRLANVAHVVDLSGERWTVDEETDLVFVRSLFQALGRHDFGLSDVMALLNRHPALRALNAGLVRNSGLCKSLQEDGNVDSS